MSSNKSNSGIILAAGALLAVAVFSGKKGGAHQDPQFVSNLTNDKKKLMNISIILGRLKAKGITNKFTQSAILAIISKESEYIPQSENLNYTADTIMRVFKASKATADKLAHNPEALGNFMYGGHGGNLPSEGYKYRGRGFNQITFKNTYKKIGTQIGYDLVSNPDLLNNPIIAADAAAQYFINGIQEGARLGKLKQYNATNINDFKSLADAFGAIYHANAGWGHSQKDLLADSTGGRKKGLSRLDSIYTLVEHAA